ncbi:MAG TPA: pentapeptide repeat-containing protein [Anaerolineales bacterium]|nr:pentapeptide repeat-containing protein [Anaerolineales bacterium]HJN40982.1 pentapeptide repeat-containing protein [Anaerolineales bacterium]
MAQPLQPCRRRHSAPLGAEITFLFGHQNPLDLRCKPPIHYKAPQYTAVSWFRPDSIAHAINFSDADMTDATLDAANLFHAFLAGVNLSEANLQVGQKATALKYGIICR